MAGEQHRGVRAPGQHARVAELAGVEDPRHVPGQASLVARLRGHVDELQRARGQALAELGVAERGRHGPRLYLSWRPGPPAYTGSAMQRTRNGRVTPSRYAAPESGGRAKQRAFCVGAMPEGDDLSELQELLRTAGVATVGELVQHRERPHPNLYLGPGKIEELKEAIKRADANVVAVDDELSPRQERNLEQALDPVPVIDRTAIILDIFADHAHTAEGKLQVELAQLEYNLARMRGLWTHLERLGAGRIDGGIGTRGPGESQIE